MLRWYLTDKGGLILEDEQDSFALLPNELDELLADLARRGRLPVKENNKICPHCDNPLEQDIDGDWCCADCLYILSSK